LRRRTIYFEAPPAAFSRPRTPYFVLAVAQGHPLIALLLADCERETARALSSVDPCTARSRA